MARNKLLPFAFDNQVAHGAVVSISEGVDDFLSRRDYTPDVRALLGQALAAMPLMTTHMHFEGRINLQFQGGEHIKLLVAQTDHHLNVRAMAKCEPNINGNFQQLLSGGVLALMLEPNGEGRPSSQALVRVTGETLAQALEVYFEQSEQLPTLIRLAAGPDKLAAFMLQRLPLQSAKGTLEDWEHLLTLASTLGDEELLATDPETVLYRLFSQDSVRVFDERPVQVECRCSHAGISALLLSLGKNEVDEIVADQGRVAITCEFCGKEYLFQPHDVEELFHAAISDPDTGTRH